MVQGLWSGNLSHCIAGKFMAVMLSHGSVKALLSDDHFLGRACFDEDRGQAGLSRKRSNETHASTTDSDAPLYRKRPSQAAKLAYLGTF
jgi:hypothetical protein